MKEIHQSQDEQEQVKSLTQIINRVNTASYKGMFPEFIKTEVGSYTVGMMDTIKAELIAPFEAEDSNNVIRHLAYEILSYEDVYKALHSRKRKEITFDITTGDVRGYYTLELIDARTIRIPTFLLLDRKPKYAWLVYPTGRPELKDYSQLETS